MIYNKIVQNFVKQMKEINKTSLNNCNNVNDINECARMLNVVYSYKKCM